MFAELGHWYEVKDGDLAALALVKRHYSEALKRRRGHQRRARHFTGPGEKLVLLTADGRACWSWRKEAFRQDQQAGVCCVVFRNESSIRSSELVQEADALAWRRWPGERHFTFVDPSALPAGANPGYCFIQAGWRRRPGATPRGLRVLERLPERVHCGADRHASQCAAAGGNPSDSVSGKEVRQVTKKIQVQAGGSRVLFTEHCRGACDDLTGLRHDQDDCDAVIRAAMARRDDVDRRMDALLRSFRGSVESMHDLLVRQPGAVGRVMRSFDHDEPTRGQLRIASAHARRRALVPDGRQRETALGVGTPSAA